MVYDIINEREKITNFTPYYEKEFYHVPTDRATLGAVLMVKNEKKRIHVSLNSLIGFIDCLIIYDTGSIDNTKEIIISFCETNKINLYMITGEFTDFASSRNVVLDYAETKDCTFLLLMDCNDELRGGEKLKQFIQTHKDANHNSYLFCQQWYTGGVDKYFNVRFLRNKKNLRYNGVVHEYINSPKDPAIVYRISEEIYLYQDRTQDDDKSGKRFARDKVLLYGEYKKNPKDARTVFYLAQTCACLGQNDEALYYNRVRRDMKDGFLEERFHSNIREGDLREKLEHSWYDQLIAYFHSLEIFPLRLEPYIRCVKYYRDKNWKLAFYFANICMQLNYPDDCILFVDKKAYDYERYHYMGIVGFYANKLKEGKEGCTKAVEHSNFDVDKNNLKIYSEYENKEITVKNDFPEDYVFMEDMIIETKDPLHLKSPRELYYITKFYVKEKKYEDALYTVRRITKNKSDYKEEKFYSFLLEAEIRKNLDHSWDDILVSYIQAMEIFPERIEPFIKVAEHYTAEKQWVLAFFFLEIACSLPLPDKRIKMIDLNLYSYTRWHMMGIVGFYSGKFEQGKTACIKAIKEKNNDIDRKNFTFYIEKDKTARNKKDDFFDRIYRYLQGKDPDEKKEVIMKQVEKLWNERGNIGIFAEN